MREGVPYGEVMGEVHAEDVAAAFPGTIFGSWYFAVPLEHVGGSICVFEGFGDEAEGVVAPPVLPFLFEAVDDEFVDLFFLH